MFAKNEGSQAECSKEFVICTVPRFTTVWCQYPVSSKFIFLYQLCYRWQLAPFERRTSFEHPCKAPSVGWRVNYHNIGAIFDCVSSEIDDIKHTSIMVS